MIKDKENRKNRMRFYAPWIVFVLGFVITALMTISMYQFNGGRLMRYENEKYISIGSRLNKTELLPVTDLRNIKEFVGVEVGVREGELMVLVRELEEREKGMREQVKELEGEKEVREEKLGRMEREREGLVKKIERLEEELGWGREKVEQCMKSKNEEESNEKNDNMNRIQELMKIWNINKAIFEEKIEMLEEKLKKTELELSERKIVIPELIVREVEVTRECEECGMEWKVKYLSLEEKVGKGGMDGEKYNELIRCKANLERIRDKVIEAERHQEKSENWPWLFLKDSISV